MLIQLDVAVEAVFIMFELLSQLGEWVDKMGKRLKHNAGSRFT